MENSLQGLEQTVHQAVLRLRALESENADLRQEISQLRKSLEELKKENRELLGKIGRNREDRSEIRTKLERIQEWLAILKEPAPSIPPEGWFPGE